MNSGTLLTCIIPFTDIDVLKKNMLTALLSKDERIQTIFVHDSKDKLSPTNLSLLLSVSNNCEYLHGEFGSPGFARNRGLRASKGEWVTFWDSDDFAFQNKVLEVVSRSSANVIVGKFRVAHQSPFPESTAQKNDMGGLVANPGIWRIIIRRKLIKEPMFSDHKLGEDILFLIKNRIFENSLEFNEEVFYEYRISPSQSTQNLEKVPNLQQFLIELVKCLDSSAPHNEIVYSIFWRQAISLVRLSKLRKSLFVLNLFVRLLSTLSIREMAKLLLSIRLALRKGAI